MIAAHHLHAMPNMACCCVRQMLVNASIVLPLSQLQSCLLIMLLCSCWYQVVHVIMRYYCSWNYIYLCYFVLVTVDWLLHRIAYSSADLDQQGKFQAKAISAWMDTSTWLNSFTHIQLFTFAEMILVILYLIRTSIYFVLSCSHVVNSSDIALHSYHFTASC